MISILLLFSNRGLAGHLSAGGQGEGSDCFEHRAPALNILEAGITMARPGLEAGAGDVG